MKASVLEIGVPIGKAPVVKEIRSDFDHLVILFDPDYDGVELEITFDNPVGFRCLDEGDLLEYWDQQLFVDHWIFEITAGGWKDQESLRKGFISQHRGCREFFICGIDDCVNVLANNPPMIKQAKAA